MTEQFLLTLDSEAAARLKRLAAERGQTLEDYARHVVETALHDFDAVKADIDQGLADVVAGKVRDYDQSRIIERGRSLLPGRSRSA